MCQHENIRKCTTGCVVKAGVEDFDMSDRPQKRKNNFVVQAGILAVSGIIVRMIGLLYRSPLTSIIGDEGNGYYSYAYNIYAIILLVSSYSIPSALSKVVAGRLTFKQYKNAHRVFQCAILYVILVGGGASLIAFLGAPLLVGANSVLVLRIFAPTIFLSGLCGVLRGYFQAYGSMLQTSVSQIFEQIVNAAVSIGGAWFLTTKIAGPQADDTAKAIYGAVGGALGTGAGVLTALLFMLWVYLLNRPQIMKRVARDRSEQEKRKDSFKVILGIVTPFILSTFVYNFSTSLNQTIFSDYYTMVRKMTESEVAVLYGIYSGKAVVISNIPIALASAMSAAVIPTVAASFARGDKKTTRKNVQKAVKVTMLISIPSAVGLGVLAKPIMQVLFWQRNSLDQASAVLAALAITVIFYALSTLTNAVLQGIGRVTTPVFHAIIALVVQTALLVVLLLFTDLGLYSLVLAAICYSFCMCMLNQLSVRRHLKYRQEMICTFVLPVVSALIMGTVGRFTYEAISILLMWLTHREGDYVQNIIAVFFALLVAVEVYFFCVIRLKAITKEELMAMPKGTKIVSVLKKMHVIK